MLKSRQRGSEQIKTQFEKEHWSTLAVYFLGVFVGTIIFSNPFFVFVSLLASFVCLSYYETTSETLKMVLYILPFGLFALVINSLVSQQGTTEVFHVIGRPIFLETILLSLSNFLILLSVLLWFRLFSKVMSSDKIQNMFGGRLPKLALVVTMVLRFIPRLMHKLDEIKTARTVLDKASQTTKEKLTASSNAYLTLFSWSLEDGLDTANTMNARGFTLEGKTFYVRTPFRSKNLVSLLFLTALLLLLFLLYMGKNMYTAYIPKLYFESTSLTYMALGLYTLFCFYPLLLELVGDIKWKLSQSKI